MDDFYFQGGRDYLHSTQIFNHIVQRLSRDDGLPTAIDFLIHRETKMLVHIVEYVQSEGQPHDVIGEFSCDRGRFLVCETGVPISLRRREDDADLLKMCRVAGKKVFVSGGESIYSPIEKIVSAYKELLFELFGDSYGRFMFARLQLGYVPAGGISICHDRIIANRYFQGSISVESSADSEVIGKIFFGVRR